MEDMKIVELYWNRDEQAIPATAEKYGRYCATIAENVLNSREDTEECVNDTWLHAWNAMPPHRPDVLSAFLGRVTRNLAFNRYKSRNAQKRRSSEADAVLEELENCVSGTDCTEKALEYKELVRAINDFLAELPEKKRSIFVCRYWYADSENSIAGRFGMTRAGVSMTLTRLRGALRTYLTERGFEL